jgi:hypothetical protein
MSFLTMRLAHRLLGHLKVRQVPTGSQAVDLLPGSEVLLEELPPRGELLYGGSIAGLHQMESRYDRQTLLTDFEGGRAGPWRRMITWFSKREANSAGCHFLAILRRVFALAVAPNGSTDERKNLANPSVDELPRLSALILNAQTGRLISLSLRHSS